MIWPQCSATVRGGTSSPGGIKPSVSARNQPRVATARRPGILALTRQTCASSTPAWSQLGRGSGEQSLPLPSNLPASWRPRPVAATSLLLSLAVTRAPPLPLPAPWLGRRHRPCGAVPIRVRGAEYAVPGGLCICANRPCSAAAVPFTFPSLACYVEAALAWTSKYTGLLYCGSRRRELVGLPRSGVIPQDVFHPAVSVERAATSPAAPSTEARSEAVRTPRRRPPRHYSPSPLPYAASRRPVRFRLLRERAVPRSLTTTRAPRLRLPPARSISAVCPADPAPAPALSQRGRLNVEAHRRHPSLN